MNMLTNTTLELTKDFADFRRSNYFMEEKMGTEVNTLTNIDDTEK